MQASTQSRLGRTDISLPAPELYPASSSPVLDPQTFEGLQSVLDPVTLQMIYAELLKHTRVRLAELEQAKERDTIQAMAHGIRGSAGMLGAAALAATAAALEVHSTPMAILVDAIGLIRHDCAALEAVLRERQVQV